MTVLLLLLEHLGPAHMCTREVLVRRTIHRPNKKWGLTVNLLAPTTVGARINP